MASKDKKTRLVNNGYAFEGGLTRKGGVNPAVSQITERPPPPPPFGGTGGVRPAAQSEPQADEGASAGNSNSSD